MYISQGQLHKIRESLQILMCLPYTQEAVRSQVKIEIFRINRLLVGFDDAREAQGERERIIS